MSFAVCDIFIESGHFSGAFGRALPTVENTPLFLACQLTSDVPTVLIPLDGVLTLEHAVRLRCGNGVDVPLERGKSIVVPLASQLNSATLTLLTVHDSAAVFLASGSFSLAAAARSLLESADGVGLEDQVVQLSSVTGSPMLQLSVIVKLSRVPAGLEPFFAQQVAGLSVALEDLSGSSLPTPDTLAGLAATVRRAAAGGDARGVAQMEAETQASIARGTADLASPNIFMPAPLWYGALGGPITIALPARVPPAVAPVVAPSLPTPLPPVASSAQAPDLALVDGFLADLLRWKTFTAAVGGEGVGLSPAGASPPRTPSRSSPAKKGGRRPLRGGEGVEDTSLGDGLARSSTALLESLVGAGVMERGVAAAVVGTLRRGTIGRGTGSGRLLSLAHLADGGRDADFAPTPLAAPRSALAGLLARTLPRTLALLCDREAPADFRAALEAIARGAVAREGVGQAGESVPGVGGVPPALSALPSSSSSAAAAARSPSPAGVPDARLVPPPPPSQRGGGRRKAERVLDGRGTGRRPIPPAGPSSVPSVASFSLNRTPPRSPGFNTTALSARDASRRGSIDSAATPSLAFVPPPVGAGVRLPAHLRARMAALEEERRAARMAASRRAREEAESGPGEGVPKPSFVRTVHEAHGGTRGGEGRQRGAAPVAPVPIPVLPAPPAALPLAAVPDIDIAAVGAAVHAAEVGSTASGTAGGRYAARAAPAPVLPPALSALLARARLDTQKDRRGPSVNVPAVRVQAASSVGNRSALDISGASRSSRGSSGGSSIASSAAAQARRSAAGALLLMPSARANVGTPAGSKALATTTTASAAAATPSIQAPAAVLRTPPRSSTRSRPASSTPARSVTFAEDVEGEEVRDLTPELSGGQLSLSTASTHSRTLLSPGTPAIFRARPEEAKSAATGPPGGTPGGPADLSFLTRTSKSSGSGASGVSDIVSVASDGISG